MSSDGRIQLTCDYAPIVEYLDIVKHHKLG